MLNWHIQVVIVIYFIDLQLSYGQKFVVNTTLTDGEGIERLWSTLRRYKHITKEMSINNRHDFLTEALLHISGKMIWNMGKYYIHV